MIWAAMSGSGTRRTSTIRGVGCVAAVGDTFSYILAASLRDSYAPTIENDSDGFRVASNAATPEPGSISLLVCGVLAGLLWWRRRR